MNYFIMTKIHNNDFDFKKGRGVSSISFVYDGKSKVSNGQPFGGVTSSGGNISVQAGRHKTKEVADWYKSFVNDNTVHMVHTGGGSKDPAELNFAIKGTLTINGHSFEICLGQGSNSGGNNWHLASVDITTDADNKNAEIGNGIRLSQKGNSSFEVTTSIQ